jgi:AcrR family transcriptional regulator
MPRSVDHEARKREIIAATNEVISEVGLQGLTLRGVGEKLGGSTTLVTHYYSSQADLLDGFATSLLESWQQEVVELERGTDDPRQRLLLFLRWLLPLSEKALVEETSRINLLAEGILGADTRFMFEAWETQMRDLLRAHLDGLVPPDQLEGTIEMLRVVTNGLTLSAIEHPDLWPAERQLAVLRQAVSFMGLLPEEEPEAFAAPASAPTITGH